MSHRGEATSEGKKREGQLLRKHGKTWLGPLAKEVVSDSVRFERGFLAAARSNAKKLYTAEASFTRKVWATVEELEFGGAAFSPSTCGPLLVVEHH